MRYSILCGIYTKIVSANQSTYSATTEGIVIADPMTDVYVYNPSDKPVTSVTVNAGKGKVSAFDFGALDFSRIPSKSAEGSVVIPCSVQKLGEALYLIR